MTSRRTKIDFAQQMKELVDKAAFGRNQRGLTDRDRNLLFSCELHVAIKKMRADRAEVSA